MKKYDSFFQLLFLFLLLTGCKKDEFTRRGNDVGYDIILVAGQSNTHFGKGIDSILDAPDERVFQLGRFGSDDYKIIPVTEPLHHHTRKLNHIGFALTFAKLYVAKFLEPNRNVLIIPCGRRGSGFRNGRWNTDAFLYLDAVQRVNYVLRTFKNSRLTTILWHQGEDDVSNPEYQSKLDDLILSFRKDMDAEDIPFILGGMVPAWVNLSEARKVTQEIIQTTPQRISKTGYADPTLPFEIAPDSLPENYIHYTAAGLRELGKRYFEEYEKLR